MKTRVQKFSPYIAENVWYEPFEKLPENPHKHVHNFSNQS